MIAQHVMQLFLVLPPPVCVLADGIIGPGPTGISGSGPTGPGITGPGPTGGICIPPGPNIIFC